MKHPFKKKKKISSFGSQTLATKSRFGTKTIYFLNYFYLKASQKSFRKPIFNPKIL
jgi:hypothetical protein